MVPWAATLLSIGIICLMLGWVLAAVLFGMSAATLVVVWSTLGVLEMIFDPFPDRPDPRGKDR